MGSRLENNSTAVRKRIQNHAFSNEDGDEYGASKFGGFPEYFRRKKIKLQNLDAELRSQSGANAQIFRGVVAQVNGYTQPSLNDLHRMIVAHGGGFMQYLDGKTTVTHIICSNLTPKKAVEFKRYRIVKPAWVVDSLAAGKLLPWDNYRVLAEGAGQRVIGFDNGKVVSHADEKTNGYREEIEGSWYTTQLKSAEGQTVHEVQVDSDGSQEENSQTTAEAHRNDYTPINKIVLAKAREDSKPETPDRSHTELVTDQMISRFENGMIDDDMLSDMMKDPVLTPELTADDRHDPQIDEIRRSEAGLQVFETEHNIAAEDANPVHAANTVHDVEPVKLSDAPKTGDRAKKRKAAAMLEFYDMVGGPAWAETEEAKKRAKMTAEERNAELLSDPRIRKSTVVNPEFLEQYYRESRLHHLSTWKADLKAQLQAMAAEKSASQKQHKKRPSGSRRYILHVDFDSFFAAVSLKKYPQFIDKPAVVAHGSGSGSEIASCNYPARKYGVKNGMWMKRAQELCPDIKVMPYDFPAYEVASKAFYEAILATGGLVQSVSIDEALVDITGDCLEAANSDGKMLAEGTVDREQSYADSVASKLREEVLNKTGCNVSVGIGGNILLAKVALRKAKPAGQYQIRPDEILDFIGALDVQDLPGVAYSIGGKLEDIGVKYIKDVREVSREKLIATLGPKTGEKIWEYARGIDRTEVGDVVVRKSVSAEVNWGVRFETQEQVDEFIGALCGELEKRLLKEQVKGKQLTVKIMKRAADAPLDPPKHLGHGKCDTFNKSCVLGIATNSKDLLTKEALVILKGYAFSPGELRGLGVQMTRLEPIKTKAQQELESSQRRLQFKAQPAPREPPKDKEDPISDDIVTPKKTKPHIDGSDSAFGAGELYASTPSRKPLNLAGTQFVVPSQIDPSVLAELPEDIRNKIAKHIELSESNHVDSLDDTRQTERKEVSFLLPNQSQLDTSILNDLPTEVRDEILQYYRNSTPNTSVGQRQRRRNDQSVLPQSPRKIRTVTVPKKPIHAPQVLRRRGRPSKFAVSARNNSTLTQSNFIAARAGRALSPDGGMTTGTDSDNPDQEQRFGKVETDDEDPDEGAEPSADFLAALPEDIRREVLDEQRRARLKKKSGLEMQPRNRLKNPALDKARQRQPGGVSGAEDEDEPLIRRLLALPARRPRPTFTTRKLSSLPDLRDAICAWWEEFRIEGPYDEDVTALGTYLERVVADERDMSKATAAVKWLDWTVREGTEDAIAGERGWQLAKDKWLKALERTKQCVQSAVQARGLGKVEL